MKKYKVLRNGITQREGDKTVYRWVGDVIEVSEETAAWMVPQGFIEPADKPAPKKSKAKER